MNWEAIGLLCEFLRHMKKCTRSHDIELIAMALELKLGEKMIGSLKLQMLFPVPFLLTLVSSVCITCILTYTRIYVNFEIAFNMINCGKPGIFHRAFVLCRIPPT